MNFQHKTIYIFCILLSILLININIYIYAQDTLATLPKTDSVLRLSVQSPSGVDTTITFYAADTAIMNVKTRKMLLKGNAQIDFKTQKLTAEIIEIDFEKSTLHATFRRDSNNQIIGVPKFNDNGEEFFGEELTYNFKTKSGIIKSGETKMGDGFYYGDVIKRVSEKELYVSNSYYTTCDAPHPHYHFGSKEMKMIVDEKAFVDPLIFYVENIPIFEIPFGLFLPVNKGRRSGLIVPSFSFSANRGVVFEDFGYYWAASDYWDTKLTANIYTKGGFILNNYTRWALKDIFSGSAQLSFGETRLNFDDEFENEWKIILNHQQTLNPYENISVNLNLSSPDFNRNTSTNINERVKQQMYSTAAYSKTFENGMSASLSFQNNQDIITGEYRGTVPLVFSIPQFYPVKKLFEMPSNNWYSWIKDMAFAYRLNANYNFDRTMVSIDTLETDDGVVIDTTYINNSAGIITHSPTLSVSPKLGRFTVTPGVSFLANNFFRSVDKSYNPVDSSIVETYTDGFFTEYSYSFSLGVSTRIYGIFDDKRKLFGFIKPDIFGIKAFRHTYQPNFNFSYTPDFSQDKYGFYGEYYDERSGRYVKYSHYEKEGGAHPSMQLQKRISYNDVHSFEIKKQGKDTLPDVNTELLRLTFSASYNFATDSLNMSDIYMSFRTPAINFLEFSGNANFTLYDQLKITNETSGIEYYTKINQFLISNDKGLARLTNLGFNISTSFSSDGFISNSTFGQNAQDTTQKDTSEQQDLGAKFVQRNQIAAKDGDIFGENTSGYAPIKFPWSVTLGLNFNYDNVIINNIKRQLNLTTTLNFTLAETWKISTTLQYDFINWQIITPQLNLTKDLHCWDLTATWYPSGYSRGFYLRFGIKSAQLKDLKIEKKDGAIY